MSSARSAPAPGDARLAGLRATAEARAARRSRPPRPRRTTERAGRQLPGPARRLPAARNRLRRRHGRPRRLGGGHPSATPPRRCRRRRTTPPPPRPAVSPAAVRRTRARSARPSAPSSPCPRSSRPPRWASGSRTWPPGTARSPAGSRTGRASGSRPRTPITVISARRFPPWTGPRQRRDLAAPQARDPAVPRTSSSAPPTVTPTGRPQIDVSTDLKRWTEQRAENPKWSATRLTPSGTTPRRSPVADIPVIRMLYQEKVLVCMEGYDELVKKSLRAKNSLEWHLEGPIGHEGDASFP